MLSKLSRESISFQLSVLGWLCILWGPLSLLLLWTGAFAIIGYVMFGFFEPILAIGGIISIIAIAYAKIKRDKIMAWLTFLTFALSVAIYITLFTYGGWSF